MKSKVFLATAVMFLMVAVGLAEKYEAPSSNTPQPISINYGGVKISTIGAFLTDHTTVTLGGSGVVYGVLWSTGNTTDNDFVEVWDATSTDVTGDSSVFRIYNVANAVSSSTVNIPVAAGFSGTGYPIRFNNGLIWKPSSAEYNSISLLYWKQD